MHLKSALHLSLALLIGLCFNFVVNAQSNPYERAWPDTDFSQSEIDLESVMSGGPPRDGIPSIDTPQFDTVEQAALWLDPKEPVIALEVDLDKGEVARAYPLQLLIYHEIINDQIGGLPVSVTFCPLCNSSIAFDRRVDGQVLEFGTTGLLRKSDMVMYDRQTDSWWQQILGRGIVGEMTGVELKQVPSLIVSFDAFRTAHPKGKVVNQDTGHSRPYGNNPYRGYDKIGQQPFLFRDKTDPRLPAMERVIHLELAEESRLYPFSIFDDKAVLEDELADEPIVLFSKNGLLSVLDNGKIADSREVASVTAWHRKLDDQVLSFELKDQHITDKQTGSQWGLLGEATSGPLKGQRLSPVSSGTHFAFAWLAFKPETEIYGQ